MTAFASANAIGTTGLERGVVKLKGTGTVGVIRAIPGVVDLSSATDLFGVLSREIDESARWGDAIVVLIGSDVCRDTENIAISSRVVARTGVVGLFATNESIRFAERCSTWSGDRHRFPGVVGAMNAFFRATGPADEGSIGGRGFIRGGVGGLTIKSPAGSSSFASDS